MRVYATTVVTQHTSGGGEDSRRCFSLKMGRGDVRIVNMKMGPFERARTEYIRDGRVEIEVVGEGVGIVVDDRVPEDDLTNGRWCPICCPFNALPENQQRAYLGRMTAVSGAA